MDSPSRRWARVLVGQCDFHTSFDGGRTWIDGHLTVPSDFADPPCRTFDSGGYAHFDKSVVFGSGQNVYVADEDRPVDSAVAAAAVARTGGLLAAIGIGLDRPGGRARRRDRDPEASHAPAPGRRAEQSQSQTHS